MAPALARYSTLSVRALGVIFGCLALVNLFIPDRNLAQDGVDFDSLPVAGRAEVRAYYVGTALGVSFILLSSDTGTALKMVTVVLGGFAVARGFGYILDGADANPTLALNQHAVFVAEVAGCSLAALMLALGGGERPHAA